MRLWRIWWPAMTGIPWYIQAENKYMARVKFWRMRGQAPTPEGLTITPAEDR